MCMYKVNTHTPPFTAVFGGNSVQYAQVNMVFIKTKLKQGNQIPGKPVTVYYLLYQVCFQNLLFKSKMFKRHCLAPVNQQEKIYFCRNCLCI